MYSNEFPIDKPTSDQHNKFCFRVWTRFCCQQYLSDCSRLLPFAVWLRRRCVSFSIAEARLQFVIFLGKDYFSFSYQIYVELSEVDNIMCGVCVWIYMTNSVCLLALLLPWLLRWLKLDGGNYEKYCFWPFEEKGNVYIFLLIVFNWFACYDDIFLTAGHICQIN